MLIIYLNKVKSNVHGMVHCFKRMEILIKLLVKIVKYSIIIGYLLKRKAKDIKWKWWEYRHKKWLSQTFLSTPLASFKAFLDVVSQYTEEEIKKELPFTIPSANEAFLLNYQNQLLAQQSQSINSKNLLICQQSQLANLQARDLEYNRQIAAQRHCESQYGNMYGIESRSDIFGDYLGGGGK